MQQVDEFDEKVSVVIPTFNRQETLLRAIKSVLKQTFPVHEILVCDDGSFDNSKSLVLDLNNPLIKWLDCGKNGMPSIPRNKGIQVASGEWIAFLDSDDEWLPNKVELQLNTLKETKSLAVSCNAFRIVNGVNKGPYLNYRKHAISFIDLLKVNNNICSSVMINKNVLTKISLFPEEIEYKAIEDYALWLRISTKFDFSYINKPLINYHDNPKSSIRIEHKDIYEIRNVIFKGFLDWIKNNDVKLIPKLERKLELTYSEIIANRKFIFKSIIKYGYLKIREWGLKLHSFIKNYVSV